MNLRWHFGRGGAHVVAYPQSSLPRIELDRPESKTTPPARHES